MTISSTISKLWQDNKLPFIKGLLNADGSFYELGAGGFRRSFIDITENNYNEDFSYIDIAVSINHMGIDYYCGGGSHGSDGWILAMANNKVEWLFFDYVNPFEKLWIQDKKIHAVNNLGVEFIFPIGKPQELYYKVIDVHRSWHLGPEDTLDYLYKRPRIDYRVSEYVVDYIFKTIPQFDKILDKNYYRIAFSFSGRFSGIVDQDELDDMALFGYYTDVEYITDDISYCFFRKKSTFLHAMCDSIKLNENITPAEYADIVYDMVSILLRRWYKRLTKEFMDDNKNKMDYDYINSFEFPASFENQRYDIDIDGSRFIFNGDTWWDGEMIKAAYKKHYGELVALNSL